MAKTSTKKTNEKTDTKDYDSRVKNVLANLTKLSPKKKTGDLNFMRLGDKPRTMPRVSTGIPNLDDALGGGIPLGRVIEIYGENSSGKTTVVMSMLAAAQRAGLITGIVDAEHTFDPEWAIKNGVDVDNLILVQPTSGEQAAEAVLQMAENGVRYIALDSIAAMTPQAELDGEMEDQQMGLQARMLGKFFRKAVGLLAGKESDSSVTLLCINQVRVNLGQMFGNPETTPGGKALKFAASIRIRIGTGDSKKKTDDQKEIGFKVEKNKTAPPFRKAKTLIQYDYGIDFIQSAISLKVIEKSGAWYKVPYDEDGVWIDQTTLVDENGETTGVVDNRVALQGKSNIFQWTTDNFLDSDLRARVDIAGALVAANQKANAEEEEESRKAAVLASRAARKAAK